MRITREYDALGRTVYRAELSEYDAEPPVREWIIDEAPIKINPDLEAVALYLIFGPWCGGEFTVPQKMSPNTAAAVSRHAGHDFFCTPIEYYPKKLPGGENSLTISDDIADLTPNSLISLFSAEWNGGLRSTNSAIVVNNGSLFGVEHGASNSVLAVGLLFVEDLAASTIFLASARPVEQKYQSLLREIGINLAPLP